MSQRVVLLGVGNVLMADEGVGVRCVQRIEAQPELAARVPAGVRIVDGGTSTHELLEDLEHLDVLVIVDAAITGNPPGTLVRIEGSAIPASFSNKLSPHQHGINDLLATLTLLDRAPGTVVLFGVEPAELTLRLELSATVEAVMPRLIENVLQELASRVGPGDVSRGG